MWEKPQLLNQILKMKTIGLIKRVRKKIIIQTEINVVCGR